MNLIDSKLRKCRACLVENNSELMNWTGLLLAGNYKNVTYLECFQMCTRLEAYEDDQLPQMLCFKCAAELRDAYEFIQKATQSHQTLLMKQELILEKLDENEQAEATSFEWIAVQKTNENVSTSKTSAKVSTQEISSEVVKLTIDGDSNFVKDNGSIYSDNFDHNPISSMDDSDSELNFPPKDELANHVRNVKKTLRRQAQPKEKNSEKTASCTTSTEEDNSDSSYVPEEKPVRCVTFHKKKRNKEPTPKSISKEMLLCHMCPRTFKTIQFLKRHTLTHDENRKRNFTCEHCGKAFYDSNSCKKHYRTHVSNEKYACKECDKTFLHKRSLITHMRTHTGDTFECKICGKVLLTEYSYRNHTETHDINRKTFQCTQCEKSFLQKKCFVLHMQTHTDGLFRCNQCDKPFLYKESLDNHMLRHLGLTVACEVCGKKFPPTTGELKSHMRTHSNEKPYKCQYCDQAFSRSGARNKHELQHEGFRYKCKVCDKEYANQGGFAKHKLKHMSLTMKCSICGKGFNDKFKMKRHIAGVHKIELTKTEEFIQKVKTRYEFRGYIIDPV